MKKIFRGPLTEYYEKVKIPPVALQRDFVYN